MIANIDGDLITYRCAASCQKREVVVEDFGVAVARADNMITNITVDTGSTEMRLFLSGGDNFRKAINPQYKANRVDVARPVYLEDLREYLVTQYGATVTDGNEADDELAIAQTLDPENSILCSLDKDLKQVPGHHYSWYTSGTSSLGKVWERPATRTIITEQDGLANFYWQFIMGDAADNIFGYDGKCRNKVPNFLLPWIEELNTLVEEQDMFNFVRERYNDDERLIMNGACLWMQRFPHQDWRDRGNELLKGTA